MFLLVLLADSRAQKLMPLGGHTSEGADLAFGLAVYGTCQSSEVLRKGPPKVGDAVILTKVVVNERWWRV